MDYATISNWSYFGVLVIGVVVVIVAVRGNRKGNPYWRGAAATLGLALKGKNPIILRNEASPFPVEGLKQFLPVLNDPAHILTTVRELSGTFEGNEISLVQAAGAFKLRISVVPAQTSAFYFFGHIRSSTNHPLLLLSSRDAQLGDKILEPLEGMSPTLSSAHYTVFSFPGDNNQAAALLDLLERQYSNDVNVHLVVAGNDVYLYSTYRPDLVRWAKLLTEIKHIVDAPMS